MLVLSRKVGEAVVIGGNIRVKVVSVHGHQVRLGLEAPDDVTILREELHPAGATSTESRRRPAERALHLVAR